LSSGAAVGSLILASLGSDLGVGAAIGSGVGSGAWTISSCLDSPPPMHEW